jgi:hypothetical protein
MILRRIKKKENAIIQENLKVEKIEGRFERAPRAFFFSLAVQRERERKDKCEVKRDFREFISREKEISFFRAFLVSSLKFNQILVKKIYFYYFNHFSKYYLLNSLNISQLQKNVILF